MEGIRRLSAFLTAYARDERKDLVFEKEVRGRGGKVRAAVKVLEGAACPLCGQPVQETDRAFGCTAWKAGCPFTLWKDAMTRAGGPRLTAAIAKRLLQEGQVQGSTGTIQIAEEHLRFTKTGEAAPAANIPVRYVKKAAAAKAPKGR